MDLPRDYHIKWNKLERERQILYGYHLYVDTNELIYETETDTENRLMVAKMLGKGWIGI